MISWSKSRRERLAARFVLSCMLLAACSCSSRFGANDASALDFTLVNLTRMPLKAVYVSSSGSDGWEENVLRGDEVNDGQSVEIRFSPEAQGDAWDLKVEGAAGDTSHSAEWKGLDLRSISKITLRVRDGLAVAEVE